MLQNILDDMAGLEARIRRAAPMGYTLAINVRLFTPEFFLTSYPCEWMRIYHARRYALIDPATMWCRFHDGAIRWSDIELPAMMGLGRHVLKNAKKFDLNYGAAVSVTDPSGGGVKSLLSAARKDRELTDHELHELTDILTLITAAVGLHAGLTAVELESLRDLASGMTQAEIAEHRDISSSTVKKRIERARVVLGAKNAVHAVAIATNRGLILTDQSM